MLNNNGNSAADEHGGDKEENNKKIIQKKFCSYSDIVKQKPLENSADDNNIDIDIVVNNSSTSTSTSSSRDRKILVEKEVDDEVNGDDDDDDDDDGTCIKPMTKGECSQCNKYDQFLSDYGRICLCDIKDCNQFFNHQLSSPSVSESQRLSSPMLFGNPSQLYNYINRCRRWIPVWRPKQHHKSRLTEFTVTTYNILAQNLLLNHLDLYQSNIKSDLEWLERCDRLKQELTELDSDIFCLQEVHIENFTSSILPLLNERGYQAVFKQKTGDSQDGCSIIFKQSKFKLQDSLAIQMNQKNVSHLLDRDQVGLIVKLHPIVGKGRNETKTNLVVASTHLLFNPKRGDIKLAQLRLLLAEIQRFAIDKNQNEPNRTTNPFEMKYHPIIFCGDFNSEPSSPLIKFLENGQFDFRDIRCGNISGQREGLSKGRYITRDDLKMNGIDWNSCYNSNVDQAEEDPFDLTVKHVFDFKSVYPPVDKFKLEFISTSSFYDSGLVDYLFYSNNHPNLRLSAYKQLINRRNLKKIGTIPNSILGSDHISLSAKFYIS